MSELSSRSPTPRFVTHKYPSLNIQSAINNGFHGAKLLGNLQLLVPQIPKKFNTFYGIGMFITAFTIACHFSMPFQPISLTYILT
jgi:hypothetical protein